MANPYAARVYGNAQKQASGTDRFGNGGDPRKNEAMALSTIAKQMEEALVKMKDFENVDPRERLKVSGEFRHAITKNWKLWTIFQTELLSEDNEQPADITQDMLKIATFIDHASPASMLHNKFDLVESMISINRSISAGLLKTPE